MITYKIIWLNVKYNSKEILNVKYYLNCFVSVDFAILPLICIDNNTTMKNILEYISASAIFFTNREYFSSSAFYFHAVRIHHLHSAILCKLK